MVTGRQLCHDRTGATATTERALSPADADAAWSWAGLRNRPDPSVRGMGSARRLLFSRRCGPGYRNGDKALVPIMPPDGRHTQSFTERARDANARASRRQGSNSR
jgi:hypothetical protein